MASPLVRRRRADRCGPTYRSWHHTCRSEGGVEPRSFAVDTGTDGTVRFQRVGVARLGDLGALDLWWLAQYGGGLFVPLKDALAGSRTYGGGRYILDTAKGADLGSIGDRL